MSAANNDFQQFRDVYESGLQTIAETKAAPPPKAHEHSQVVQEAVATSLHNLKQTQLGQELYRETELGNQLRQFEDRLLVLAGELPAKVEASMPPVVWASDAICRLEREYEYYGEMGRILHYFRNRSEYLTHSRLEHHRASIIEGSRDVGAAINDLLSHVVSEVLFSKDDLRRLRRLADEASNIGTLTLRPGRDLDSLLPEDDTFVRRQFIALTCQLALRLFGHITRRPLDAFLSLKSANEVREGYARWREGADDDQDVEVTSESSITRLLNRSIESAYRRAEKRAAKENWPTLEIIRHSTKAQVRGQLYVED